MGRRRTSEADLRFRRDVADKIAAAMKDRRLSRNEAARDLDVTRQALHQYLHAKTTPQASILARACAKWKIKLPYRGEEFAASAFGVQEVKTEPPEMQLDLFKDGQVLENSNVEVRIQRTRVGALQVTIKMKKAEPSVPRRARRAAR